MNNPSTSVTLSNLKRGAQIQTSFIKEETNQVQEVEQFSRVPAIPKKTTAQIYNKAVEMVKTAQMVQKETATMKKYTQELTQSKYSLREFVQNVDNLRFSMETLAEECNEGRAEILTYFRNVRDLEAICKSAIDAIVENAISNAHRAGDSLKSMYGLEIGYSAEYLDHDQDPEYKLLKTKLKAREEQLKNAYKSTARTMDEETGEIIPRVEIKTTSKPYLKRTR